MRSIIITLLSLLPLLASAQAELTPEQQVEKAQRELEEAQKKLAKAQENARKAKEKAREERGIKTTAGGWIAPVEDKTTAEKHKKISAEKALKLAKKEELAPYLSPDAVPIVDGKVEWTYTVDASGQSAEELYTKSMRFLEQWARGENALKGSKIALLNPQAHSVIATMREWLVFSSNFLSLDRTEFCYVLQASCVDGFATLSMNRVSYNYDEQGHITSFKAEDWITDEGAVNKKRTRLLPLAGKFRRKTIDRKDEVFKQFRAAVKD